MGRAFLFHLTRMRPSKDLNSPASFQRSSLCQSFDFRKSGVTIALSVPLFTMLRAVGLSTMEPRVRRIWEPLTSRILGRSRCQDADKRLFLSRRFMFVLLGSRRVFGEKRLYVTRCLKAQHPAGFTAGDLSYTAAYLGNITIRQLQENGLGSRP